MRDYDVLINGETYHFGQGGGMVLGKADAEPGGSGGRGSLGTIPITSFHGGPGQIIQGDPIAYLHSERMVSENPGLLYPSGESTLIHTSDANDFDGIHGVGFFEKDNLLFIITPKRVFKIDTNSETVSVPANTTLTPPNVYTGSVARWRGKYILGVEKTPATPIGGDSSARYSESGAAPIIYDIATDAFAALGSPDSWEFVSHIFSARGTLWWVQNRGKYGPPELYWTDKATVDFGSIAAADTFGPFRIEQGGYTTGLFMAGPHILLFKRDGSILGVDEQKIWVPYSPSRGTVQDDLFGLNAVQYGNLIIIPDNTGSLVFNPGNLTISSVEPFDVQQYPSYANAKFMAKAQSFAVRGRELYAIGQTRDGSVNLYTGVTHTDGSFHYSSDFGIFAAATSFAGSGGAPERMRRTGGGSVVRPISATRDTVRKALTAVTVAETPLASSVTRHTDGGEHYHLYAATRRDTDGRLRVYRIDLYPPGKKNAPGIYPTTANMYTSKLQGEGVAAGVTKIPTQIRGYLDLTDIKTTGTAGQKLLFSLALDEGSYIVVGEVTATGAFSLPMPATLGDVAGRNFSLLINGTVGRGFRLELPLFIDFLLSPNSTEDNDEIVIRLEIGTPGDRRSMKRSVRPHDEAIDTLLDLKNTSIDLEFHWGAQWKLWVENVSVQQIRNDKGSLQVDGKYLVTLTGRRVG